MPRVVWTWARRVAVAGLAGLAAAAVAVWWAYQRGYGPT